MADSYSQALIWTVLPFGQSTRTSSAGAAAETYLNFSVLVSPRLTSSSPAATDLSHYPDWASTGANSGRTWPDSVAALLPGMALELPALPGSPRLPVALAGTHASDAIRFASVFPATTLVTPYLYQGLEGRRLRSAPVASVVDTIAALYGRFGLTSATTFPPYEDLVPVDAFGPIGFEQDNNPATGGADPGIAGEGPGRRQILEQALEGVFANAKAIPYDLSALAASLKPAIPGAETSLGFLQHQRFLQRGLRKKGAPTPPPQPPVLDFHQLVAGATSLPTLLRLLGIVLDLSAGPVPDALAATWHPSSRTTVQLIVDPDRTVLAPATTNVTPPTMAALAPGVFRPAPLDQATADVVERMLRLGDPSLYRVITVDHDNAVVKTMQFANTVTRSRKQGAKLTLSTPDGYALPALRSGGFAVARAGRATQMAATLDHQTHDLQEGYFSGGTPLSPPLYEEDVTRGYRLDVLDQADGVWRSVMWRQGSITVDGTDPVAVLEEDTVVPAPATAPTSDAPDDLYLQETLTRWDGWSLAVPRLGTPFQGSGPTSSDQGSAGFRITTDWQVPGSGGSDPQTAADNAHRLPRLRFGRTYQLRARAADLAGNALTVEAAPTAAEVVSPPLAHLRFEPVPAPRVLLVTPATPPVLRPGDSDEVVVIRSESSTVAGTGALDNAETVRLVMPAPTSVSLAEQHGVFDLGSAGAPMNRAAYADIATRDAQTMTIHGTLVDPSAEHGTANPYTYPGFLPVHYLPEVLGRVALVRGLPPNAAQQTVAQLPFDTAAKGWPQLQACRIRLSRGEVGWATTVVTDPADPTVVTTELDLTLATGDQVTTMVNGHIEAPAAQVMAIWQWIQQWAAGSGADPAPAWQAILSGEHWMVTPWRQVTFVHAVRTPLARPRLFLHPAKTALGQTFAQFDSSAGTLSAGSVLMSRKSTARIDVDGTWTMPVDTGSNPDPVTPQTFQSHAFTLEPPRDGGGVDPEAIGSVVVQVPDADNFTATHEFNDTKFRAVTYVATATSRYVEYFREQLPLVPGPNPIAALKAAAVTPGVAFEASTVDLSATWTDGSGSRRTRKLVAAPPGTDPAAPAPTPGDYVVVEDPTLASDPANATHGTVRMLEHSPVTDAAVPGASIELSYVGPTIHTFSDPAADKTTSADMVVPSSARPAAPHIRYVIPIYQRTASGTTVTRQGGGLRVYLDRPWWSSGDEERLGVVCWHPPANAGPLPTDAALRPYVSLWGFDPVFTSTTAMPGQPTPAYFPLATSSSNDGSLTIEEVAHMVDVAGHSVGYDPDRKLWYCDIQVTGPDGQELKTYTPFIRFAFARYQPYALADAHLSKVVLADYAQLAPDRSVTVTGTGTATREVTVAGRAPVATDGQPEPSRMFVLVEQKDTRIADDALAWRPATGAGFTDLVELTASTADQDTVTWHGTVALPQGAAAPLRLTLEEYERVPGGAGFGRLAFTDSLPVS